MGGTFCNRYAIELKLGTRVPLGNSYLETKSRTDIIPHVATRGQYVKCYDARSLTMGGTFL